MKKLLGALVVTGLLAISTTALANEAQRPRLVPICGDEEATVFEVMTGTNELGQYVENGYYWASNPFTVSKDASFSNKARAFKIPTFELGCVNPWKYYCNDNFNAFFFNFASVAQWLEVDLSNAGWVWLIKKPGTYVADCINLKVKSNNEVYVDFTSISNGALLDLPYEQWGVDFPESDSNDSGAKPEVTYTLTRNLGNIATASALPGLDSFVSFNDLEGRLFADPPAIATASADGYTADANGIVDLDVKMWNKIKVGKDVAFGNYFDAGVITVMLKDQVSWLDNNRYDLSDFGVDLWDIL